MLDTAVDDVGCPHAAPLPVSDIHCGKLEGRSLDDSENEFPPSHRQSAITLDICAALGSGRHRHGFILRKLFDHFVYDPPARIGIGIGEHQR